ncbi:small ribosomal subunit protein uS13 [Musca domestica]|uniref:Small ribosomal subunit protein uS13 n=1 Tax=Musca domestica TaxID=7370 RepID=A0A9J7DNR9_MUSDO|nr:small ribosomal subunit protein uS13 [Musca domestica]
MSCSIPENFQHILCIINTNTDGKRKVGINEYIDLTKHAGECTENEVEKIVTVICNPLHYKVPNWFLKNNQLTSSNMDSKLCDDSECLKKIRSHQQQPNQYLSISKYPKYFWIPFISVIYTRLEFSTNSSYGHTVAMNA